MEATDNILRSPRRQPSQQLLMATADSEIMARSRGLTIPDPACRPAMEASEPSSVAPELYGHAMTKAAAAQAASEAAPALAPSEVTATHADYVIVEASSSGDFRSGPGSRNHEALLAVRTARARAKARTRRQEPEVRYNRHVRRLCLDKHWQALWRC